MGLCAVRCSSLLCCGGGCSESPAVSREELTRNCIREELRRVKARRAMPGSPHSTTTWLNHGRNTSLILARVATI
ncbi:hypothetical protein OIU76_012596 [Salix suchowensis]|nr:hypothetical protein OIU76_012596 [Salix suchowensis]